MTHVSALLSSLEDPFQMFPIEAVSAHLAELVSDSRDRIAEQSGWLGVSRKYYSVEQEHHLEMISLLIGSVFVLCQAAVTQAVSIARSLRTMAGEPSWLPANRDKILQIESTIHAATGLSEIALIDAVANYFKHHHEWPRDWTSEEAKGSQVRTIELVRALGLTPGSHESNLEAALRGLGVSSSTMGSLARKIQQWRERLAQSIRSDFYNHGFE
jgi:hypothetical protein